VGGATWLGRGRSEIHTEWDNLNERDGLEALGIVGRIILKWIL
jgi:hypothetical protein